MLNITIRVYYAVMPVCAVLPTAMLLLIAHEVGRIRRRRGRRRQCSRCGRRLKVPSGDMHENHINREK